MADDIGTRRPAWLAGYRSAGGFDELVGGQGEVRAAWRPLLGGIGDAARLKRAEAEARRAIRDGGATYTVYGGGERPWAFDPLPLPISAAEWGPLAAGLIERAQVLEAVLRDLYGDRTLVCDGVIPARLLHADPGFLRACHAVPPPGGRWLHLLAVDLVRGADGAWRVLADRAQAPSGLGYALLNRGLSERVLPAVAQAAQPAPLTGFLAALGGMLTAIAERPGQSPAAPLPVVLSPGPYSETYFEHAYLAGLLGIPLVRGLDLTVRDHGLHLDTLSGPIRVDSVLRRLDDSFADPLELRADSQLGVAGLLQAVRRGGVAIANPLGAGLIDSRALAGRLPQAAQRLLGRPPRLAMVDALWGPDGLAEHVAAEPAGWIVAASGSDRPPIRPAALAEADRADLLAQLRERPEAWVGRARVRLSTAPTLVDGGIQPRPIVLRCFLVGQGADGWAVMPGGLVRYGQDIDEPLLSMQRGGGSKDVLVPASADPAPSAPVPIATLRAGSAIDLSKRVGDNLFWFGRYAERTDAAVRLARAALARFGDGGWGPDLAALARALARLDMPLDPDRQDLGLAAAIALSHGGRFGRAVAELCRLAVDLRDRLTPDLDRLVADLAGAVATPARDPAALALRLEDLRVLTSAIGGMIQDSMPRAHGGRLLHAGRRLERAMQTIDGAAAMLAAPAGEPPHGAAAAMLSLVDSAHRWRSGGPPELGLMLEQVVCDLANPRSVGVQLGALLEHLRALPGDRNRLTPAIRVLEQRRRWLAQPRPFRDRSAAAAELAALAADVAGVADLLAQRYLGPELWHSQPDGGP